MRRPVVLLLVVLAVVAAGCATRASRYTAPAPARAGMPTLDPALFDGAAYDPRWWTEFEDPALDALEAAALEVNHDIRIAVARLAQARAVFDDTQLDRYPTVTAGASVDRREQAQPGFSDEPIAMTTYRAGFDAFWELDFFGRVRSAVSAASADAQAFEATLDDVRVLVAAEVARAYFELRGLQHRLAVAERSLENQRQTLRLTEVRRDAGFGETFDVASASAQVAAIEASLPPLRAAIAVREHRLAVLTAARPGALAVDVSPRPYPPLAKALPVGDPTALLQQRPDVRAAERRLAAATAREGVAYADLFPRVTLSGFLGLVAGRGNLFGTSDSRAWAVSPALQWAAFDLGSARARLRGAEAGTREALALYQQTVLTALEEASNALVSYREQQQRLLKLHDQARESARAADIARVRYREGVTDFLNLLDAERTELAAQDAVAAAEADVFTGAVAVYKSLGGVR
jgi:multidrug efflux system outer membrane protein